MRILRILGLGLVGLGGVVAVLILAAQLRLMWGTASAERSWNEHRVEPLGSFGSTEAVSILPLVDWHTSSDSLEGEAGVSYLIRTDDQTILFDTGFNREERDPAPLSHNMRGLGLRLGDVDTVFISHLHPDHVGGFRWFRNRTFSIGNTQPDLSGKRIFVPVPMTYPGSEPVVTGEPTVIGEGVASIGSIPRQLFVDLVEEQALAIHLRGRGVLLVLGCGHQTLAKVIERARRVFEEPIYGVIGGLHYPVPEGRGTLFGVDVQYRLSSGSGPFNPIRQADVEADIERLRQLDLGIVGVGGHDSSDEVIARFAEVFDERYRHVRVGDEIRLE